MEEERRLAYVAVTRAKDELFILHSKNRLLYGQTMYNPISRFVSEIPEELLEKDAPQTKPGWFEQSRMGGTQSGYGAGGIGGGRASTQTTGIKRPAPQKPHDTMTITQPIFKKREASSGDTFTAGDRVRHAVFGEGEVLSVRAMGSDVLYEIAFDRVGTKKMMATYAKLKKV